MLKRILQRRLHFFYKFLTGLKNLLFYPIYDKMEQSPYKMMASRTFHKKGSDTDGYTYTDRNNKRK